MKTATIHDMEQTGSGQCLAFDLIDILRGIENAVLESSWQCHRIDCIGPLAEALHRAADTGVILSGVEFWRLAIGVQQVIDGQFESFSVDKRIPWLEIRAIDSSYWEVASDDAGVWESLTSRFHDLRPVQEKAV